MTIREKIKKQAAKGRRFLTVPIDGLGDVTFRSITARERIALERDSTGDPSVLGLMLSICRDAEEGLQEYTCTVLHHDGRDQLKYDRAQYKDLVSLDGVTWEELTVAMNSHCVSQRTLAEMMEDAKKNSWPTPSECSPTE